MIETISADEKKVNEHSSLRGMGGKENPLRDGILVWGLLRMEQAGGVKESKGVLKRSRKGISIDSYLDHRTWGKYNRRNHKTGLP